MLTKTDIQKIKTCTNKLSFVQILRELISDNKLDDLTCAINTFLDNKTEYVIKSYPNLRTYLEHRIPGLIVNHLLLNKVQDKNELLQNTLLNGDWVYGIIFGIQNGISIMDQIENLKTNTIHTMDIKGTFLGQNITINIDNKNTKATNACHGLLSRLFDLLTIEDFSFCIKQECPFFEDCITKGFIEYDNNE